MTYSRLLELIEAMSPEQKEMDVLVSYLGDYITPVVMTQLTHNDDEEEDALPIGQPILV